MNRKERKQEKAEINRETDLRARSPNRAERMGTGQGGKGGDLSLPTASG